jgi:hypothetical protein
MALVAERFRPGDADAAAAILGIYCEPLPSLDEAERIALWVVGLKLRNHPLQ